MAIGAVILRWVVFDSMLKEFGALKQAGN